MFVCEVPSLNPLVFFFPQQITSVVQVVDEIYSYCDHVAPWAPGTSRVPSSAFCLLMKLFVMKLTRPQMNEILMHEVCAGLCCAGDVLFLASRWAFGVHRPARACSFFK